MLALGPTGLRTRGKVKPRKFFPPFCHVLARCGIASAYVHDAEGLQREIAQAQGAPVVLIDLVNETYHDLAARAIPERLASQATAVFNSRDLAGIVRDKREANRFLSARGVPMPSMDGLSGKRIFSNVRVGSAEPAFVYDSPDDADEDRYNTEFIDTRVRHGADCYYACVRLMCIGPHLVQVLVRARNVKENNPTVHAKDTPADRALLDRLIEVLVAPQLGDYSLLSRTMAEAMGPGFYSHDVLVEKDSGKLYVCETGFKFYNDGQWSLMGHLADRTLSAQESLTDQRTYASRSAAVFMTYCIEMGFL